MKYSKKADALRKELTDRIAEIVSAKGSKDGFKTVKVIDLDSKSFLHNSKSASGTVIQFIGSELMYNKYGDDFSFSDLEIDDLAELVDTLEVL